MRYSADDQPLSPGQLALEARVSESVLRTWAKRTDRPLERVPSTGRTVLHTWAQLRAFCEAHPDLPAARRIARLHASSLTSSDFEVGPTDPEQVRAVIRNLRAAANSNLNAALIAARHAERTAIANREQLEALAASIHGYDDLLTQLSAPITLHD